MVIFVVLIYFDLYFFEYVDLNGIKKLFVNKIDGGMMVNNLILIVLLEVMKVFKVELEDLEILFLGIGYKIYIDGRYCKKWGFYYWMRKNKRKRLIELFM